jgi:alkylhydroperoxidase family enzyme
MEKGLTEEKISRLGSYRTDSIFSEREKIALEFAELMALDHKSIGDDFFRRMRAEFSDAEVVELGMAIGQYIGFGRLLMVLDLERPVCEI